VEEWRLEGPSSNLQTDNGPLLKEKAREILEKVEFDKEFDASNFKTDK
jgi:hypothetical protein